MTIHRHARRVAPLLLALLLAVGLSGCRVAKVGARCSTTDFGRDTTHVLVCRGGRWQRLMTLADAADRLAHPYGIRASVDFWDPTGAAQSEAWVQDPETSRVLWVMVMLDGLEVESFRLQGDGGARPDVSARLGGRVWAFGFHTQAYTRGAHRLCVKAVPFEIAFPESVQPGAREPFTLSTAAQASPDLACAEATVSADRLRRAAIDRVTWHAGVLHVTGWVRPGFTDDWRLDIGAFQVGFQGLGGGTTLDVARPDVDATFGANHFGGPFTTGFDHEIDLSAWFASPPTDPVCLSERYAQFAGQTVSVCVPVTVVP